MTEPLELTSLGIYSRWQQRVLTVPNVTCTNTEYMNVFPHSPTMWTGREDKEAEKMVYAQLGMEDTEAMRRLRYDGIWAFMYAGWTKTRTGGGIWKGGFHDPTAAMLHSSLSPVLTSLDLCDPDYLAGQDVITPLCLINDSWHDAKVHVDLMLTEESPEFIPEAACLDKPLAKWSFDFAVKADSLTSTPVRWKVPEKAGSYYLTARTTATTSPPQNPPALWPTRAVLSQRFVRSVPKPEASEAAKKKTVVLLGADEQTVGFFKFRGLKVATEIGKLDPAEHVVIVWRAAEVTELQKKSAGALCDFAAAGGKVIVLGTQTWDWKGFGEVEVGKPAGSRVYAYEGVEHPLVKGLDPQWLIRWNGVPGTVATSSLAGPLVEKSQKLLWVVEKKSPVAAEVPAAAGTGKILFVLLDIPEHVNTSKANYDPVAENLLMKLVGK